MPRCTRPGASRFSVAIAATCTGGIRVPQMAVPWPQADPACLPCGQGQHGVAVREDHLAVGDPDRVVAEALGVVEEPELHHDALADLLLTSCRPAGQRPTPGQG